ncbi:uncharacterized protein DUF3857 [Mucilaginibacter gracilis]|uniref:Uncharacterized protein DUF3857 n=1 Tax=Mucilaginibacter gracilis TaxID=423350 RepID=A0A495J6B1_9SPHI|nr:DUF3857 domain-containing protein [Mucilaginibacter gracilis]RKR84251.1 uncharacterized protein DUF3857 [Mucilaginibacter gracilis]
MKNAVLIVVIILFSVKMYAQDFPEGKFNSADIEMTSYDKDPTAHAVVLKEFGKTWVSTADHLPIIHEYHVKIKIFDDKGFNEGNVAISLYNHGENYETVRDIKAHTFYKDDNGLVREADLDPAKIYKEKKSKNIDLVKFALPNLRKGCVIEYSYSTESPYHYNFHSWDFQSDIPKIYSEYEVHIPAVYEYNIVLRGYLSLTKSNAELERECFDFYGTKADCSKINYIMSDVPAFVEESDMTAPSNYISAMYFELAAMTNENGVKNKITQEWTDIDRELKGNDYFGTQMKRKELLKDRIPASILAIPDTLAKAQAIYTHLQKWFKWDHIFSMYSDDGIKKALDSHTGHVGDINLSLISALNAAGISADAVILSTRDNGAINKLFPQTSDFDYVVARLIIHNKVYMLDATDPLLAFGMLPLRCINDQGRVMSLSKPSYWIDMVETNKSTRTSSLDLTIQSDGKIKGTVSTYYVGYAAYKKRLSIKRFNSVDEYVENLAENNPKLKISKSEITNLDSLNSPLSEKYDIVINNSNNTNGDNIVFNPAFWDELTENPFKLKERTYPVDLGSTLDHRVIVALHYPANYVITRQPEPVSIGLPNKGGKFVTLVEAGDQVFNYSEVHQLSKAIYQPEEYPYIKELYNKIIQNQKATIVLSKKP